MESVGRIIDCTKEVITAAPSVQIVTREKPEDKPVWARPINNPIFHVVGTNGKSICGRITHQFRKERLPFFDVGFSYCINCKHAYEKSPRDYNSRV